MHPDRAFRWADEQAVRAFVADRSFAAIFVRKGNAQAVVHAPVVWCGGELHFHVSNGNRAFPLLEGGKALATVHGPDHYVSPDWYEDGPQHVPTWNYAAVELEGPLRRLAQDELISQIDMLTEVQETKLAPKPAWHRSKMDPARFSAMLGAITAFALEVQEVRATRKFSDNKASGARRGVEEALRVLGANEAADWVRA